MVKRGSPQPRRGRHKLHLNQATRIGRKLLAAVVPLLKVTAIRARDGNAADVQIVHAEIREPHRQCRTRLSQKNGDWERHRGWRNLHQRLQQTETDPP